MILFNCSSPFSTGRGERGRERHFRPCPWPFENERIKRHTLYVITPLFPSAVATPRVPPLPLGERPKLFRAARNLRESDGWVRRRGAWETTPGCRDRVAGTASVNRGTSVRETPPPYRHPHRNSPESSLSLSTLFTCLTTLKTPRRHVYPLTDRSTDVRRAWLALGDGERSPPRHLGNEVGERDRC